MVTGAAGLIDGGWSWIESWSREESWNQSCDSRQRNGGLGGFGNFSIDLFKALNTRINGIKTQEGSAKNSSHCRTRKNSRKKKNRKGKPAIKTKYL